MLAPSRLALLSALLLTGCGGDLCAGTLKAADSGKHCVVAVGEGLVVELELSGLYLEEWRVHPSSPLLVVSQEVLVSETIPSTPDLATISLGAMGPGSFTVDAERLSRADHSLHGTFSLTVTAVRKP